ncbi:uncharacterized protein TNIN_461101 [Trichonephila inaurata madagascariensis]|uniref:Uncharacterized protein n=1 Tax=Trichonephila inaurata madagascariensis TaxID=2747483 RepID=A0A8X6ISG9_9ARAC|nr:uncharacterized protein TNIN_461101 [Trichonephila inaurata madagascariensis]
MLTIDILNASVEALEESLEDSLDKNVSNLMYVPLKRKKIDHDPEDDCVFRGWTLCIISAASVLIYITAINLLSKYSKRHESWYCTYHWLLVSSLNGLLYIPTRLSLISFVVTKHGEFAWWKHFRRYFLTLYAYVLVTLALYSYNLVFRTFFKSPLSRKKFCMVLLGLYAISSFPTLYFLHIYGWNESDRSGLGYLTFTWQFAHYPGQHNILVLLLCNYIIPICLIMFLLGRICFELFKRKSFFVFVDPSTYPLTVYDRKFIAISFCSCVAFVIVNVPFVIQEIIIYYINPDLIDIGTAALLEMISISNVYMDSCFYLMFELGHYWIKYKIRCGDFDKWLWDGKDNKKCTCGYEPVSVEMIKGDLTKVIDNTPHLNEQTSDKEKIQNETL